MLLSYIDYLIEGEFTKITTCSIYDKLVSKWLEREAEKRKGIADRESFMKDLENLSFKTAIAIYTNWRKEGRMYVTKEEALRIAEQFAIQLKPEEITGQSLLTCDGIGNWKFAHKSILEYFLANEALQRPMFLKDMNFKGMDMAKKIYEELDPRLILFDQSKIKDKGFPNEIKRLPEYYIYNSRISHSEFVGIMHGDNDYIGELDGNQKCSFKAAIAFCNKMNIEHGYSPVYDDVFNFIKTSGNTVSGIEGVRGFRLPTPVELQTFFIEEMYRPSLYAYAVRKAAAPISKVLKLKIETAVFEVVYPTLQTREWCYDGRAISVFGVKKGSSEVNFMDFSGFIKENIEIVSSPHMLNGNFNFRLVFVP